MIRNAEIDRPSTQFEQAQAIVETVERLGLSTDDYVVIGGANLVLRGLKTQTPDIDMLVSGEGFVALANLPNAKIVGPPTRSRHAGAANPSVHIDAGPLNDHAVTAAEHMADDYFPMTFAIARERREMVAGVPLLDTQTTLEWKLACGRDKDLKDVSQAVEILSVRAIPEQVLRDLGAKAIRTVPSNRGNS
jgi:hypothetical protein